MRKKEHISNCEIAKKIIPFYNSYNYAGLRSKGNKYTHDDFCVSDSEYEEESSNENNEEYNNLNDHYENSEVEIVHNSYLENTLNKKSKKNINKTKKKRKNIIIENSYESNESDDNISNDRTLENNYEKNKKFDKDIYSNDNINNDENYYRNNNNDDVNSDLEIFSSSPVLPSVDFCMENLFNNSPKAKNKEENNSTINNDFLIDENLVGNDKIINEKINNDNDYNKISSIIENFNNEIKDPLNLFSNDINNHSYKHSSKIHNKISNTKLKNKSVISDDFEIDENLIGNNNFKQKQKNKEKDTDDEVKELTDLFSNDNIKNTLNNPSTSYQPKKENNLYDTSQKFHTNNNNVKYQIDNSNDELNELYNLFTNDIKDSTYIESDEEFIMSSNSSNSNINNKLNVKNLYSISDNNDSLELINSKYNIENENDKKNLSNFDKIKAENELLQLFNDEIERNEYDNINSESDDDIFSSQMNKPNKKKYFKQPSISSIINNEKKKEEIDIKKNNKKLLQFENKKGKEEIGSTSYNNDDSSGYIKIFDNNQEKISLSINQNGSKKNKLDFYFKQLPISSTSISTLELPSTSSNNKALYPNEISYYNIKKGRKRANDDNYNNCNPTKNPFIINKKQKTEVNFKNNDEHNSLNNVLLKFESNEKLKIPSNNNISMKKRKKQVSLLSLFSSQNENKKDKNPDVNSIIDSVIKPKTKENKSQNVNKPYSLINDNNKIYLRTWKTDIINNENYIEPLIYILTSDKKENYNYSNANTKPKTKILRPNNNIIYNCQQIENHLHSSRHCSISNNEIDNSNLKNNVKMNIKLNDNYDLMKNHILKKKHENNLVNNFIDSFINKHSQNDFNKEKSTWPKIGWNRYFQNSIENTF